MIHFCLCDAIEFMLFFFGEKVNKQSASRLASSKPHPQQTKMDANLENIRQKIDVIQSMIDISTESLEGLRTQCIASAEITQREIRTLETKLIKMFAELLITKLKLPKETLSTGAELKQWLKVVGKLHPR